MTELTVSVAIKARRSTRSYKNEPIPHALLEEVLRLACMAPSAKNGQPWRVTVLQGARLEAFRAAVVAAFESGKTGSFGASAGSLRSMRGGRSLQKAFAPAMEAAGVSPAEQIRRSIVFFDAPAVALVSLDEADLPRGLVDAGLFVSHLCLAAQGLGLDSCIAGYVRIVEGAVSDFLNWGKGRRLILGVALGYGAGEPIDGFKSPREPFDETVEWEE